MYHLGLDPGLEGALVLINEYGILDRFIKMPVLKTVVNGRNKKVIDSAALVEFITKLPHDTTVCIEKVTASPQMGVVSAFSFGQGLGLLEGILAYTGFQVVKVTPARWKRDLMEGLPQDKEASLVAVNRLRPASAKRLFTKKADHNLADAFLIAEWGRRHSSS